MPDQLWLIELSLPNSYFGATVAVFTPPDGTSQDAADAANVQIDSLHAYLPDTARLTLGEPSKYPPSS